MAESLKTILMSALTSKATPAESDTLIVGEGNTLKKISFSQLFTHLKDKLGINALNAKIVYRVDTYTGEGRSDIKLTKNPGSDYRCICAFNASYESQADNNISSLNYFHGDPVAFFVAQFTTSQKMQIGTVWMKK